MLGLYVHIPFCNQICPYCDFFKMVSSDNLKESFVKALLEEMNLKKLGNYTFNTVYIGGGSPSCLKINLLEEILFGLSRLIDLDKLDEFTIELNPHDITEELVFLLSSYHITRVSIGVQTFSKKLQNTIKRFIDYEELVKKFNILNQYHINNINIDLMYAIPTECIDDLDHDLKLAISLNPTHLSIYSLILEEHTIFYHLYKKNELSLIDEELEARMYHHISSVLTKNGFFHYETSNYAKKGYESIHNLIYWNCDEYIAIGPSACSYYENYRFKNVDNLKKYLEGIQKGLILLSENKYIDMKDKMNEEIILGLRKCSGISKNNFFIKYFIEIYDAFPKIKKLLKDGLLKENKEFLFIPQKYFYISNYIITKIL